MTEEVKLTPPTADCVSKPPHSTRPLCSVFSLQSPTSFPSQSFASLFFQGHSWLRGWMENLALISDYSPTDLLKLQFVSISWNFYQLGRPQRRAQVSIRRRVESHVQSQSSSIVKTACEITFAFSSVNL